MYPAVTLILAVVLLAASPARAEVPPHFEATFPAEGSKDVPTNTQLWVYGESLRYTGVTAVLTEKGTGRQVPVSVESLPVGDLGRIDIRRDQDAGAVGASGIRDLFVIKPQEVLAPKTAYTLDLSAGTLADRSIAFTTGTEADLAAPEPARGSGARHEEGGLADGQKRPDTLFNVWTTDKRGGAPIRVEVLAGNTAEAAELRSYVYVPPKTYYQDGVVEGLVSDCLYFRSVDTAGNAAPVSACVRPQDLQRSRWTVFSNTEVGYEISYPEHFMIDAQVGGRVGGSPSVSWSDPDRTKLKGRGRDYYHRGLDPSLSVFTIFLPDFKMPGVNNIEDFAARQTANGYLVDARRSRDRYEGVCPKTEVDGMSEYVTIIPDGPGRLHVIRARLDEANVVSLDRGRQLLDAAQKRAIESFRLLSNG